ncbi:hypothetical protein [Mesorhizobium sp. M1B.F.Ca.ET.045.04.1.1]|uniref:hypothetical protein n=1 Tax=Mesorhizobium sp. M1B.F.Ca.ET.045.04.1.1 TaxID=2493673 RepID=UPI000F75CB87|nr:hypothetical protein [Mesorhizobium sp. M1B.F.Ca.ET.045.04.1.1]AZO32395.1 hypothetical protein EJ071_36990 [Mesorhizobium sp. M1B.F.Ca.ET.045.04.1.1]TKB06568.1 MAG: hypothetical protein E5V75_34755 [Mesorhizobium sp.]
MTDKFIMIIRHAEKPLPDRPELGVDELGQQDDKSLTVRGWQRAGALACFFCNPPPPLQIPKAIVASAPIKKDGSGSRSLRPTQTITSLAQRLKIEPDTRYSKGQEKVAGPAIGQNQAPTLVCWQHESIPDLAAEITQSTEIAPTSWDDDDYDSIWILRFSADEQRWSFSRELQRLLPGDRQ